MRVNNCSIHIRLPDVQRVTVRPEAFQNALPSRLASATLKKARFSVCRTQANGGVKCVWEFQGGLLNSSIRPTI